MVVVVMMTNNSCNTEAVAKLIHPVRKRIR